MSSRMPRAFGPQFQAAAPAALAGDLVTFGIRPDRAETGYGWLELSEAPDAEFSPVPQSLRAFVEKPDQSTAASMLKGGRHLWNAGIFLFSTTAILEAFEAHAPDLLAGVKTALSGSRGRSWLLPGSRQNHGRSLPIFRSIMPLWNMRRT